MQFFLYPDEFRLAKQAVGPGQAGVEPALAYHRMLWMKQFEAAKAHHAKDRRQYEWLIHHASQLLAEDHWYKLGKPYVKVFPKMAQVLSKVRLSVPLSILRLPYPVFEIRLSAEEGQWLRETPDAEPVQSLFVFQSIEYFVPDTTKLSMAMTGRMPDLDRMPKLESRLTDPIEHISVHFVTGFPGQQPSDKYVEFPYKPDKTIEELLDDALSTSMVAPSREVEAATNMPKDAFVRRLLSLVLATCLLISGDDENVLPDLPRALVDRFRRSKAMAERERQRELEAIMGKARKSGHHGVTLGERYELELPRPIYDRDEGEAEGDGSGGYELRYTHFRSPHPRLQPYGPRSNPEYKIKWIPMSQVRPDLPINPNPRNYRITDRGLVE